MSFVLIDVALSIVLVASGVLVGWWLRARPPAAPAEGESEQQRRAREVLGRLQDLATHIAAHVGAHSSRVEEINQQLRSAEGKETETVVSAVVKLIEANQQMQQQLDTAEERLQEQARLVQTHAAEARTDALTGLANRRALDDELAQRCGEFRRAGKIFTLVMGDIDRFKRFNDRHGHQAGDEVLRGVAGVLRRTARDMDLVARYGGEEFVVILPGTPVAGAAAIIERLRQAVESESFACAAGESSVTISLGAAQLTEGEDAAALVRRADAALYAAKEAGRNCACWHDGSACRPVGNREKAATEKAAETPALPTAGPTRALCHRNEFVLALGRRLAEWRRGGASPAVALVRVDDCPGLTARHGPQASRKALQATAHFLSVTVREMDLVAEYDATTFAFLLPGAGLPDLLRIADRIRQSVARCELAVPAGQFNFTVSIGGAVTMKNDETPTLLWRAEEALDAAVKAGGNSCFFHSGQRPERGPAEAPQAAQAPLPVA